MGKGNGFGKTILFGEHFVVYGLKGIPCALGQATTCEVEKIDGKKGYELVDNRPVSEEYKIKKKEEYDNIINAILTHLNVKDKLKITLGGDLVPASGVGASAATAAALSYAINEEYNLGLNKDEINNSAYVGETAGSGVASGIDNTAAVFGGFLIFQKDLSGGKPSINNISIEKPIEVISADTGVPALTKDIVSAVRKLKEENPDEINPVFDSYEKLVEEGIKALNEYDVIKIGKLMDQNQELLRKINVKHEKTEEIIKIAIENGAIGAKSTGTGCGGNVLCLTPGKELQERVANAIRKAGYRVIITTIG